MCKMFLDVLTRTIGEEVSTSSKWNCDSTLDKRMVEVVRPPFVGHPKGQECGVAVESCLHKASNVLQVTKYDD